MSKGMGNKKWPCWSRGVATVGRADGKIRQALNGETNPVVQCKYLSTPVPYSRVDLTEEWWFTTDR